MSVKSPLGLVLYCYLNMPTINKTYLILSYLILSSNWVRDSLFVTKWGAKKKLLSDISCKSNFGILANVRNCDIEYTYKSLHEITDTCTCSRVSNFLLIPWYQSITTKINSLLCYRAIINIYVYWYSIIVSLILYLAFS